MNMKQYNDAKPIEYTVEFFRSIKKMYRSILFVAMLTIVYDVVLSDAEVCIASEGNCTCRSPPPVIPQRPCFKSCSIGLLPAHLTSINGTCESNTTIPCQTECLFKCESGYITSNESIVCTDGTLSNDIPLCNVFMTTTSQTTSTAITNTQEEPMTTSSLSSNPTGTTSMMTMTMLMTSGETATNTDATSITSTATSSTPGSSSLSISDETSTTSDATSTTPGASPTTHDTTSTITVATSASVSMTTTSQTTSTAIMNTQEEPMTTSSPSSTPAGTTSMMTMTMLMTSVETATNSDATSITSSATSTTPEASPTTPDAPSTTSNTTSTYTEEILTTVATSASGAECTVSTDSKAGDTICERSVKPGTACIFTCLAINNVSSHVCTVLGSWEPWEPDCGRYGCKAVVKENALRRKKRESLSVGNAAVVTVQETFESAIIAIPTTYLVNATTINAQNFSNGNIQMNLVIDIMYTSEVSTDDLVAEVEEALLAVDDFTVISVNVSDLDAICASAPCKNNGRCQVDSNNFDFICDCIGGYSGRVCDVNPDYILLAIMVPVSILIIVFIIVFIILVIYYRLRIHKLDGYTKRPFRYTKTSTTKHDDDMRQLFETEDKYYQHYDQETFKNTGLGLRFSKEINARMQERSREIDLQQRSQSSYHHHDPIGRHRSQTDPSSSRGRSLHDGPMTGDSSNQRHPNGIHSRDDQHGNQDTPQTSGIVYNMASVNSNQNNVGENSPHGNHSNQAASNSTKVVYNRGKTRQSVDNDKYRLPRARSRDQSVHLQNGFNETRL